MSNHPEHDKQRAAAAQMETETDFLNWLTAVKKYDLAEWTQDGNGNDLLSSVHVPLSELLAEYHDISLKRLEEERRDILQEHREMLDPLEKF